MNRSELKDRVLYCKRELDALLAVQKDMGCRTCWNYAKPQCKKFGQVPAEFVAQGCDEWDFNDCPF